jgi:hypothetical protein
MNYRESPFAAAAAVVVMITIAAGLAGASTQDPNAGVPVPLRGVLDSPGTGEGLEVRGTIAIDASLEANADGTRILSYRCVSDGTAVGQTSGATYHVLGDSTAESIVDVALPADAGLKCAFIASRGAARQQFEALVQGTLTEDGTLVAAVLRQVVAER